MNAEKVAKGLGLFSLALGAYEVIYPEHLSRILGMSDKTSLIWLYGFREIGAGAGALTQFDGTLASWIWTRVGGDVFDIFTLGTGMTSDNPKRGNVAVALGMVLGITLIDIFCARQLSQRGR